MTSMRNMAVFGVVIGQTGRAAGQFLRQVAPGRSADVYVYIFIVIGIDQHRVGVGTPTGL